MKTHSSPLVIIVAPTASGKTGIVNTLAEEMPGRIISADSMQVYRYMDIGTAKPTKEEQEKLSYHLIDVVNPDEAFNGAMFLELSGEVIKQQAPECEPVYVVGGTGLYVKILLGGLISGPGPDEALRKRYKDLVAEFGKLHLYALLQERDPQAAERIKPNDTVRVIRALEVLDLTGESITTKQVAHAFQENRDYRYLKIGIKLEKEKLQERIEKRVERMMERGMLREVEQLLAMNFDAGLKSMQSLGYRHMVRYLQGEWSLDEAVAAMKRDTWQYAKRQMTWFKKDGEILWFDPEDLAGIRRQVSAFCG
jgi:tRNA dimethylallyltransferase